MALWGHCQSSDNVPLGLSGATLCLGAECSASRRCPGSRAEASPAPARYAFTVAANIAVYGAAWLLLHLQGSPSTEAARDVSDQLGVQDVQVFQVSGAQAGHPRGPDPGGSGRERCR